MRLAISALFCLVCFGCANQNRNQPPADPKPEHPQVRVQGIDGTVFTGQLLNGSITIDSGQGPLTLLTDYINSINFSSTGDTVDSPSVKVSGTIKEPAFELKSEHGVFTLVKDRLKSIEFLKPGATQHPAEATTASYQQKSNPQSRQSLVIP
jgi:hypothetical protein